MLLSCRYFGKLTIFWMNGAWHNYFFRLPEIFIYKPYGLFGGQECPPYLLPENYDIQCVLNKLPTLQQNLRFCGGSKTHPTLNSSHTYYARRFAIHLIVRVDRSLTLYALWVPTTKCVAD